VGEEVPFRVPLQQRAPSFASDSCKGQFKSCIAALNLVRLRERWRLKTVTAAFHATATGKGQVDEESAVASNVLNQLEKDESVPRGEWIVKPCRQIAPKQLRGTALRLPQVTRFLEDRASEADPIAELPALHVQEVPVIVGAYGCGLVMVMKTPYSLPLGAQRSVNGVAFKYKYHEVVVDVQPLRRVELNGDELVGAVVSSNCVPFVRNGAYKKPFMLKLAEIVLPASPDELRAASLTRANCLGITLLPPPHVGSPQVFLVPSAMLDELREAEQLQRALGE
jgi:hypothetical protein